MLSILALPPAPVEPPGIERQNQDRSRQQQGNQIRGKMRHAPQMAEQQRLFFRRPLPAIARFHQKRQHAARGKNLTEYTLDFTALR